MPFRLFSQNAVVVARQFNPSVITDRWLERHGIVLDGEFSDGCFYTPPAVKVSTIGFELLALPDRLQLTPKPESRDSAIERISKLVRLLEHTPYVAVGINLHWLVEMPIESAVTYMRTTFCVPNTPFSRSLEDDSVVFGSLVQLPAIGGRLRLDIRPTSMIDDVTFPESGLLVRANYHFAVSQDDSPSLAVAGFLSRWNEAETHSSDYVGSLGN